MPDTSKLAKVTYEHNSIDYDVNFIYNKFNHILKVRFFEKFRSLRSLIIIEY